MHHAGCTDAGVTNFHGRWTTGVELETWTQTRRRRLKLQTTKHGSHGGELRRRSRTPEMGEDAGVGRRCRSWTKMPELDEDAGGGRRCSRRAGWRCGRRCSTPELELECCCCLTVRHRSHGTRECERETEADQRMVEIGGCELWKVKLWIKMKSSVTLVLFECCCYFFTRVKWVGFGSNDPTRTRPIFSGRVQPKNDPPLYFSDPNPSRFWVIFESGSKLPHLIYPMQLPFPLNILLLLVRETCPLYPVLYSVS